MNSSNILIVEDDPDQMDALINCALTEIRTLMDDENTSDEQRNKVRDVQIIKVNNIKSLQKAVSLHKNVLLAVMDCNIPDTKGGVAHDQLVKTNHKITGQHRSVDIISKHLPSTPITIISSLNRFQTIVSKHYDREQNLSINFIGKNDLSMIKRNIGHYLRRYLRDAS